jgi:hypothetical protein
MKMWVEMKTSRQVISMSGEGYHCDRCLTEVDLM